MPSTGTIWELLQNGKLHIQGLILDLRPLSAAELNLCFKNWWIRLRLVDTHPNGGFYVRPKLPPASYLTFPAPLHARLKVSSEGLAFSVAVRHLEPGRKGLRSPREVPQSA